VNHRFTNPDPDHRPHGAAAVFRWAIGDRLRGRRKPRPPGPPAPFAAPDLTRIHSDCEHHWLLWIGHASFLGCLGGRRFLIDPVFSRHAGFFYRRHLAPPLTLDQLPSVGAVMVTHNHYDHLDASVFRALPPEVPVVVPQGLGGWMRRHGRRRVEELRWWQRIDVDGLSMTLVPACHWSRRGLFDTNRSLWGGFVVTAGGQSVYHAGDTAAGRHFADIGQRFPHLDAAMLPIGGYHPAWFMEHHHLNPEQAGEAFLDLGARRLVAMHWGTFQLTDEPLSEPADRILGWWRYHVEDPDLELEVPTVGALIVLDQDRE
jgi:L-ascorbate metabolism protein UlaG (beta-lactamase superfamily)